MNMSPKSAESPRASTDEFGIGQTSGEFFSTRDQGGHTPIFGGGKGGVPSTATAAGQMQQNIAKAQPRGILKGNHFPEGYKFGDKPIGHASVKEGVVLNVEEAIEAIAEHAGLDLVTSKEDTSNLYRALVVDFYVNSSSNKRSMSGIIDIDGFTLDRRHIKSGLEPYCGVHYRQFTRAFADSMVAIIKNDMATFYPLVDMRADTFSVDRATAVYLFDGAEMCTGVPNQVRTILARNKVLSLRRERTNGNYEGNNALQEALNGTIEE